MKNQFFASNFFTVTQSEEQYLDGLLENLKAIKDSLISSKNAFLAGNIDEKELINNMYLDILQLERLEDSLNSFIRADDMQIPCKTFSFLN